MPADYSSAAAALSLSPTQSNPSSPTSGTSHPRPLPPWAPPRRGLNSASRRLSRGPYNPNRSGQRRLWWTSTVQTLTAISERAWAIFLRLPLLQQVAVAVAAVLLPVLSILFLVYSHTIFMWLGPVAKTWRELPGGWLIIWLMAFASAFPPMIGYSTSVTLAGLVYGFPLGWPIAASATVVGSTAAFLTSRGVFSRYVHSLVGTDKRFVALGQVLRRDGLLVLTGVRFCPLPYSLSNGFLATIPSIRPWTFALATAFVSPKLLVHVFIGSRLALLAEEGDSMSTRDKVVNYVSMAVGGLVGTGVAWVIYRRTMARAAELAREEAAATGSRSDRADGEDSGSFVDTDSEHARLMTTIMDPDDADAAALMDDDDISLWAADDFDSSTANGSGGGSTGQPKGRDSATADSYRDDSLQDDDGTGGRPRFVDEEASIEGNGVKAKSPS